LWWWLVLRSNHGSEGCSLEEDDDSIGMWCLGTGATSSEKTEVLKARTMAKMLALVSFIKCLVQLALLW
jgi:hypothetical protein